MADNTTMQNTKKKMTIQEAKEILNSNSFINYSYDELLEAVNTLKGDPTQKDLVEGFYERFDSSLEETGVPYQEFDKVRDIFEGTSQGTKWEKEVKKTAQSIANVLSGKNVELSFADANEAREILSLVPQSNEIRSAQSKLNDIVIAKMDKLIEGKEYVDIHELEAAQNLVNGIANKEKKAKAQKKLDEVFKSYEDENGLNQDVEVLRKNDKSLDESLEHINLYGEDGTITEDFKELEQVLTNVEIVEDDGSVVAEEKKAKNLTQMFEAAKLEAYQENVGNLKYLMASKNEQRKQLTSKIKDLFVAKLGMAGVASTFELPTAEEQQDESKFKAYLERKAKAADDFIASLIEGGKKLQVKVKDVITACADTDIEVSKFKDILETKLGKGKSALGKRLKAFREKSVSLWGKAYEVSRKVVKNVKEHKWQHIANTAATLAVAMSGYGTAAIIGYAAYSAAGAWVWPVVAEAQKQRAAAKANGEKTSFLASMKSAWKVKKADKDYKRQSLFGMVGAVAGGLVGAGGTSMGLDKASSRIFSGLARTASSISAQATAMIIANKEYKKNPSEENKSKWKAAKTSFYIGLGISAIGSAWSLHRLGSNVADHVDAVTGGNHSNPENLVSIDSKPIDPTQPSTPLREGWGKMPETPSAGDGGDVATGAGVEVPSIEDSIFPEQYNTNMGITESQYTLLLKLYSQEDLDRMYTNLSATGIMDHMEGMTKEEFIFKWSKLDAYTDRVRWDENAQQYISIPGAKRYHFEEEMTNLNKLLNCGDKLEVTEIEKIKSALSTIDDRGGYHGPGYVPTENYHVKGAGVNGPCGEGQENHFNRGSDSVVRKAGEGNVGRDVDFDNQIKKTQLSPMDIEPAAPTGPIEIDKLVVSYTAEPKGALAEYPSAFAGKGNYPNVNSEGYRIDAIDGGDKGLTAKQVSAPKGRLGLKLTDGDRARLTVESKVEGVPPATQDSRFLNIRDPYTGVDSETVTKAAADLGGKPEEIITVTDDQGKTTYQYISNEGIKMTIDPENGSMGVTTLDNKGAPQDIQVEAAKRAVDALNSGKDVKVNLMTLPGKESALTKVTTEKGGALRAVYARFSGGRS